MNQIGIFAKYWEPGKVKTRLAASIGEAAAAGLYRGFLQTLLDRFRDIAARRVLCYWPVERYDQFAEVAGDGWQLEPQSAGGLGERMADYFAGAFAAGASRTVLIGSDSPTLPLDAIASAFQTLDSADVVLGPSEDGGYYLVGASRPVPAIFEDVRWSSSRVFAQTEDNLARASLTWSALPAGYDVDDLDDLNRLQSELNDYRGNEEALIRLRHGINEALRKVGRDA